MSKHLFGLIITPQGVAANNRGETEGNITTLQKVLWNGEIHTTVSAEAIRWAIRYYWQRTGKSVNRNWEEEGDKPSHRWQDHEFQDKGEKYIDDDVLGFMSAEAAREEVGGEEGGPSVRGARRRGRALVRRARLEVTRAISLTPFDGDITFNAASVGATPSASKYGTDPVPYGTEVHATRYQYGLALTPEELWVKGRALEVVDAIASLSEVAGNQARFLFDFSPDAVLFRWTEDFAPRFLYGFGLRDGALILRPEVRQRIDVGDIEAGELVVGGTVAKTEDGEWLKSKGATVRESVKEAAEEIKNRLREDLGL